jgi:hypothetical protein
MFQQFNSISLLFKIIKYQYFPPPFSGTLKLVYIFAKCQEGKIVLKNNDELLSQALEAMKSRIQYNSDEQR